MKTYIIKLMMCATVATVALTACDNDTDVLTSNQIADTADGDVPEGYFRATFFPQTSDGTSTRAAVNGNSTQIQSLVCLIYKKQDDDTYKYVEEKTVIAYEGNVGNIDAQEWEWPLQQTVTFTLPKGDYKAVFVGNSDKALFASQGDTEILTSYNGDMAAARINMPEAGPAGFNQYNMFYLCTVSFSTANPSPSVLMQRVVANNVYGRNFIDTNEAVSTLVNNIVADIRSNQLTTDVVKALLQSKLTDALTGVTGLQTIVGGVTTVVDRLVNILLGDVLEALNELLLQEITKRLESSLNGLGGGEGLIGLGYILNPWTTVENVNVTYTYLPKSIDFDRTCRTSYSNTTWALPIEKSSDNQSTVSVVSLCGNGYISEINVNKEGEDLPLLLKNALSGVDEQALDGLLINIHAPLAYTQASNLKYSTTYELINLTLTDNSATAESLGLNLNLIGKKEDGAILDVTELVKSLLGDNIVSGLLGSVTNTLVTPLEEALNNLVLALDIKLPNLGIGNITASGSWDATHVSDGTIAPTETE